ncbi:MAG: hypothetical protein AAFY06_14605 [Pseudomonadota bacterium]
MHTQLIGRRSVVLGLAVFLPARAFADGQPGKVGFETIFSDSKGTPDSRLEQILEHLVESIRTDRAFIYMRDPARRMVSYTHVVSTIPGWGRLALKSWSRESDPQTMNEPLLKSAYQTDAAKFVGDIETAPPRCSTAKSSAAFSGIARWSMRHFISVARSTASSRRR